MLLEEIKEMINERYDPDDVCDALEITTEELLNAFEGRLAQNINKFEADLEIDISEYSLYQESDNE